MELVFASYSRVKSLSGELEFIIAFLLSSSNFLSVGAIFARGTVAQTFTITPAFTEGTHWRESIGFNGVAQCFCFVVKIELEPMVADFVDWYDVNGFRDTAFLSNAKPRISAQSLYNHAIDFKTGSFKQHSVIVQLDCPVE